MIQKERIKVVTMSNNYEMDKERLHKYMPQLRACMGISADILAQKIGVTKQHICHIENHLEKPLTKMQYICIRSVFDVEYYKNKDNINLHDCYNLVFCEPNFYEENIERIELAIYWILEDVKLYKKQNRIKSKKNNIEYDKCFIGTTELISAAGGVLSMFPDIPITNNNKDSNHIDWLDIALNTL